MKEIIAVSEQQASYAVGLRQAIEGARVLKQVLAKQGQSLQLFQGDLETAKMLEGGASGFWNELVHPLNEKLEKTTDKNMLEVVPEVIEDARHTIFEIRVKS